MSKAVFSLLVLLFASLGCRAPSSCPARASAARAEAPPREPDVQTEAEERFVRFYESMYETFFEGGAYDPYDPNLIRIFLDEAERAIGQNVKGDACRYIKSYAHEMTYRLGSRTINGVFRLDPVDEARLFALGVRDMEGCRRHTEEGL